MATNNVARGRVVTLTYSITNELGETVEQIDVPVSYLHGGETGLFPKIERALEGHGVGDEVSVELSPEEGFGSWDPAMTFSDLIENVPPEYRVVGAKAEFVNDEDETMTMVVTHVDNGTVTLDGNHPFAGKTVTFHVKVEGIREATAEELRTGESSDAMPPVFH